MAPFQAKKQLGGEEEGCSGKSLTPVRQGDRSQSQVGSQGKSSSFRQGTVSEGAVPSLKASLT